MKDICVLEGAQIKAWALVVVYKCDGEDMTNDEIRNFEGELIGMAYVFIKVFLCFIHCNNFNF